MKVYRQSKLGKRMVPVNVTDRRMDIIVTSDGRCLRKRDIWKVNLERYPDQNLVFETMRQMDLAQATRSKTPTRDHAYSHAISKSE